MPKNESRITKAKQDSIYKIWKFKKAELIKDPTGTLRSVALDKYDLWDLTKKGTLSYTIADSPGVSHSQQYKMINNAIVLQFPNSENGLVVQFRITELTPYKLKLIMHVTYTDKGKLRDEDLIVLVFEAVDK